MFWEHPVRYPRPSAARELPEVAPVPGTVARRGPGVSCDQPRAAATLEVSIPRPRHVAGGHRVQIGHQWSQVGVRAVILAYFAGNDRNSRGDGRDLAFPARYITAGIEIIGVPRRRQVVVWIGGLVGQPLAQVVGISQPPRPDNIP